MSNDQERSGDENRRGSWLLFRDANNGDEVWYDTHVIIGVRRMGTTHAQVHVAFGASIIVLGDAETVLKRVQEAQAS